MFAVELPAFTGPFRLLSELILEQKVDVCDVQVASVTDAFLAYAKDAERWDLEEVTWFLAMCAVLLELKVGRLMPRHTDTDEDDLLGASPDIAYARSLELAAFRKVAVELARRLDGTGVTVNCVHPGVVHTNFGRQNQPVAWRLAISIVAPSSQSLRWPCSSSSSPSGRWPRRRGGYPRAQSGDMSVAPRVRLRMPEPSRFIT